MRFHMDARKLFVKRLQHLLGIEEDIALLDPRKAGYDLKVGAARVILRFARPKSKPHWVKRHSYNYPSCQFNFHRRGRMIGEEVEVAICVIEGTEDFYCLPWESITSTTFNLHVSAKGREYGGKNAPFRNTIQPLRDAMGEGPIENA